MIFACVLRLPRDDQQIYFSLLTTEADDVERLKLVPGVARGRGPAGPLTCALRFAVNDLTSAASPSCFNASPLDDRRSTSTMAGVGSNLAMLPRDEERRCSLISKLDVFFRILASRTGVEPVSPP